DGRAWSGAKHRCFIAGAPRSGGAGCRHPAGKEAMHPIERLRWVARSPEGDASLVAAEAADALAGFADDPAGLVIASRRLIERRPALAPLWWLASRVLCSLEPGFEAVAAAAELEGDRTPVALAGDLPGGTVAIVAWPDQASAALRLRGRMGDAVRDRVVV